MVLYQWVFIEFERFAGSAQSDFDPQRLLSEYRTSPLQEIPVDADDPVIGPSAAPARLVVFSDIQCIACRRFAQQMGTLQDRFGDRIQIVFKHFPLSSKCNNLERDLHPDACEWAWAADAARRQGKFWPVHDAFFASEEKDLRSILNALAAQSGLDLVRFDKDVSADATRAKIRLDVDLGNRLGVDGTPSVFLNGHRIRTTRMRSIAFLIEHEL